MAKCNGLLIVPGEVTDVAAGDVLRGILLDDDEIVTKPLDASYLHGITRDSVLKLGAHLGYRVSERELSVQDVLDWIDRGGEAALTGTAAVLAGVGTLIYQGTEHTVRDGAVGPNTRRLRGALTDIQHGRADDVFGWLTAI